MGQDCIITDLDSEILFNHLQDFLISVPPEWRDEPSFHTITRTLHRLLEGFSGNCWYLRPVVLTSVFWWEVCHIDPQDLLEKYLQKDLAQPHILRTIKAGKRCDTPL